MVCRTKEHEKLYMIEQKLMNGKYKNNEKRIINKCAMKIKEVQIISRGNLRTGRPIYKD